MNSLEIRKYVNEGNKNEIIKNSDFFETLWSDYIQDEKNKIKEMNVKEATNYMLSILNYVQKGNSNVDDYISIKVGDICYIDFGIAFKYECGFQHLGLVIKKRGYKVFVLPMTSSTLTYDKAVFWKNDHLYPMSKTINLTKPTTLFLNDGKFINVSRIIKIVNSLDETSLEMQKILKMYENYMK